MENNSLVNNQAYAGHPAVTGKVNTVEGTSKLNQLFSDPNFISALAGMGAQLDPKGVGGALGGATQQWVQQQQMGKAMEKQDARMERLIEAMAGGKIGGATVDGESGKITLKATEAANKGTPRLDEVGMGQNPKLQTPGLNEYQQKQQQWLQEQKQYMSSLPPEEQNMMVSAGHEYMKMLQMLNSGGEGF